MPNVCHLIVDPPAEGAWNMAVDEALLTAAAETDIPTLRFYQWKHPTLSLGYFQHNADRKTHSASRDADVVRRLSGGGAILHDHELTYSLVLPTSHALAADTQQLYQSIHQAIVCTLTDLLASTKTGWRPVLCSKPTRSDRQADPFLCFQRRATGDVLLESTDGLSATGNHKIVGSAQRRRRGAILQHGSLLLSQSTAAPELLGFSDVTNIQLSSESARKCLQSAFAKALNMKLETARITDSVASSTQKILQQRYGSSSWLERR